MMRSILLLALLGGCASTTGLESAKQDQRRQYEVACMRSLLNQGISLMHNAEAMTNHCRKRAAEIVH